MNYEYITTNREAKALANDIYKSKPKLLPFDSETDCTTNAFDWLRERQVMWQFYFKNVPYLVDVRKVDPLHFKRVMEDDTIKKIIHNSLFDALWTKREHGITIRNIADTKNNEVLLMGMNLPRRPLKGMSMALYNHIKPKYSSSLNYCLQRRGLPCKFEFVPHYWFEQMVEVEFKEGKGKKATFHAEKMGKRTFHNIHGNPKKSQWPKILKQYSAKNLESWTEEHFEYDARDVEFLIDLYEDQRDKLSQLDMSDLMTLEELVAEIVVEMSCNGFGMDVKKWLAFADQEEKIYYPLLDQLKEIAPETDFESPAQYCRYFQVENADALEKETAQTVETRLGVVAGTAFDLFKEARKHYKHVTTYGKSWIAQHVYKGKVHCQYTQIVNTGRFSCDSPNLQNIVVRDHNGELTPHRSCFIPGNYKNGVFAIADFSGQELAIMAAGSEEEFWLETLRARQDLHARIAEILDPQMWNAADEKGKKKRRRIVKTINFGIAYGSGIPTLAERAEVEIEEMEDAVNNYKGRFRKLVRWLYQCSQHCVRTGTSYSFPPFNRLRTTHLESEDWRRANIGKNNPVQATGADMTKLAMVLIHNQFKNGFDAKMIHQLHDELVTETAKSRGEELKHIMELQMSRACEKILGEPLSHPEVVIQTTWEKKD